MGIREAAWDIVRLVPEGQVTTYGMIARILGKPRAARMVGGAMHASPGVEGGVPCHRVVFADGKLAPGFSFGGPEGQRQLLVGEGVPFLPDGRVDLSQCLWEGPDDSEPMLDW